MPTLVLPPIPTNTATARPGTWQQVEPFSQLLQNKQAIDSVTSSNAVWRFGIHIREPLIAQWLQEDYAGSKRHICGGVDRPTPYANNTAFQAALRRAFISNQEITRIANQAQQLGASFVRVNLRWDAVECQAKGQYNFAPYRDLVDILNRRGLGVQFILSYPNNYYPAPSSEKSQWAPFRNYQITGFAQFARQAAQHFKKDLVSFEIWNEANSDTFWQDGASNEIQKGQNFARLVHRATQAIQATNPRALVVSGGTFNVPTAFLQQIANGASNVDALGIHLYARTPPESFDREWPNISQARQFQKPVFVTETGISGTGFDTTGAFLTDYSRDQPADRPVARARQASWYARLLLRLWTKGVDQIVLYELQDQAQSHNDATARELNYGLYDRQGLKPAGRAVQQLSRFLQQGDNSNALLYNSDQDNHRLHVLALIDRQTQATRQVVWLSQPASSFRLCVAKPPTHQTLVVKNMFGDRLQLPPTTCSYGGIANAGASVLIEDVHGPTYLEFGDKLDR